MRLKGDRKMRGKTEYSLKCPVCETIFDVEEKKLGKPPFDVECPNCGGLVSDAFITDVWVWG